MILIFSRQQNGIKVELENWGFEFSVLKILKNEEPEKLPKLDEDNMIAVTPLTDEKKTSGIKLKEHIGIKKRQRKQFSINRIYVQHRKRRVK